MISANQEIGSPTLRPPLIPSSISAVPGIPLSRQIVSKVLESLSFRDGIFGPHAKTQRLQRGEEIWTGFTGWGKGGNARVSRKDAKALRKSIELEPCPFFFA